MHDETPVTEARGHLRSAERDLVALGIATAAMLLFVGTGGSVIPQVLNAWSGKGNGPDGLLVNALLLNIALIIFGWRRYNELRREVNERRRAEAQALQLAQTDALTGCLNRRRIGSATAALVASARTQGRAVATLMLDLDKFKQVNDLSGHMAGDSVLVEVAGRLREILPEGALLARLGGDEFACSIEYDPRHPDQVDRLAARIIEQVARPIRIDGNDAYITASVGIASTEHTPEADDQLLLHHADIAMYHSKQRGRNRYFWFEASMESELRFRNELETGIRRGIAAGEFSPYYQQQIDLETGELVGFEMLARWHSPQLGSVSPEIFIPIAEEIGVIAELSELLIRRALEDAKEWDESLSLAVNISPIQLRDPWFAQKLLRMLVESGFPPHRLDIEITESCLHENIGIVRSVITSLKNQGVHISLDDFGTGYSSLAQLRSLPFDQLKIDRSFVRELAEEGCDPKLIQAIVSLGKGLDLPITAEGIESSNVLQSLQSMGKMKGQGFLYGRPEDARATRARLAERNMLANRAQAASAADTPANTGGAQGRKAAR